MDDSGAPPPEDRQPRHPVVLILGFTLLIRGLLLYLLFDNLQKDPDGYRRLAQVFVEQGTYGYENSPGSGADPSAYRPPFYPLMVAGCVVVPGDTIIAITALHLGLGLATVALVYVIGLQLGLRRWTLMACLLVACDPILLYQSTLIMTETLATLLSTAALYFLISTNCRPTVWSTVLAGTTIAMATLCRPTFLVFMILSFGGLLLISKPKTRLHRTFAYGLPALLILLPWIVRNTVEFQRPIVTTTHGGYTLHLANNHAFYSYLKHGGWGTVWSEKLLLHPPNGPQLLNRSSAGQGILRPAWERAVDRYHYGKALQSIRDEPGWFAYASLVRLGRLWQLVPHQTHRQEHVAHQLLRYVVGLWYLVEFSLVVASFWTLDRPIWKTPWLWGLLLITSFCLVHALFWTNMRMRAPLVPVVALMAAAGASRLWSRVIDHN